MLWSMKSPPPVDVDAMLRRASRRTWFSGSPRGPNHPVNVLSRRTLDRLIRQTVAELFDRLRAEGAQSLAEAEARLATESRRELDALLQKVRELGASAPEEDVYFVDPDSDKERPRGAFDASTLEPGRGLDLGTDYITASARSVQSGGTVYNVERNAFLEVRADGLTQSLLRKFGIECVVRAPKAYLLGNPAFDLATVFDKPIRRPLKEAPGVGADPDGVLLTRDLLQRVLGRPRKRDEICVYSVPADPADGAQTLLYHRGVLENALRALGYVPRPMIESHAIVQAEFLQSEYTGIGITCGGGRVNVCVACKGLPALTFSTSRGGEWIDESVSRAIGMPAAQVRAIKERGMHLYRPEDPLQGAVAIYYRHLLQDLFETFRRKVAEAAWIPSASKPFDVVCAGGVATIGGFVEMFREELHKAQLPLPVAEVRLAKDPLQAVAAGCLRAAQEETEAQFEEPVLMPSAVSVSLPAEAVTPRASVPLPPEAPAPAPAPERAPSPAPAPLPRVAGGPGLRPVPGLMPVRLRES
jgi:hypothetical protein